MSKKAKPKSSPLSPVLKPQRCRFCYPSAKVSLKNLQVIQLNKKYLQTDIQAGYSCKFDSFVSGNGGLFSGGIHEFKKLYEQVRTLYQYYTLNDTRQKITQTIQYHAQYDHNKPMHFYDDYFSILSKNYRRNKDIRKRKIRSMKNSQDQGRSTEIQQIAPKTPTRQNFQILKTLKNKNQSMVEIKKLTKTVQKMCYNFSNKGLLVSLRKEFDRKMGKSKEREKKKVKCIEKKMEESISMIKQSSSIQQKNKLITCFDEDNYNLKREKKKSNKKSVHHKRMSSEVSLQKLKSQPLTPAYEFVPPSQYFCGQRIHKISKIKCEQKSTSKHKMMKRTHSKTKSEEKIKKRLIAHTNQK